MLKGYGNMWKFIVSNVTFKGVLWGSLGLALLWFLYSYTALSNDLSNANWELAVTQSKLESAQYSIQQMKLYEQQRKDWNKELDTMTAKFRKELDGYSLTLKGIANERSKNGVNNSLSEPVTRVLKDFNGK
jgi:hypothetical protein